ncbi:MAG: response regulator [Chitinophagaceae bacterium]
MKKFSINPVANHSISPHTFPHVLIIDDEEDICFMLSSILKQKSFSITSVHSILSANNCLFDQVPALIFLDNNLPDGKGVDFIPDLKKKLPEAKIVMITAYDTPTDKRLAIDNGADEFIGKPFTRQTILSVVDKLLAG